MRRTGAALTLGLAAILVSSSCGTPGPPRSDDVDDAPSADAAAADTTLPADLSCDSLARRLFPVEPTRAGLTGRFGAPDTVLVEPVPNRHVPDQTDTIATVRYDGLEVEIYVVTGGRELPDHAIVTDARFLALPALGPGAPAARLERALGPPTTRAGDTLTWSCGSEVDEPVSFRISEGVVDRIWVDWYVD